MTKTLKVTQAPEVDPVPVEVLAQSIKKIADGYDQMMRSGMTLKGILIILSATSGESRRTCENVLYGIRQLRAEFIVPAKKV